MPQAPKNPPRKAPRTRTADEGERLAKRVAHMLPCSRSEAEKYIEGGWVQVDGQVVEEPMFRVLQHTVTISPDATLLDLTPVTLMLHKPAGDTEAKARTHLSATQHWAQDANGTRVLKRHFAKLDGPVPLENGASGLVVYTQDWRTLRKLTEDMDAMEHELIADVQGEVSAEALQHITRALNDERHPLPAAKVSINSTTPQVSKLRFAVKGAHPGLVAHLCDKAGLELLALRRIRLGRVALSDLPVGQWRYLGTHERF